MTGGEGPGREAGTVRQRAHRIHQRFRVLPGADHIATETAIAGLITWLGRARPRRVLEVGAGIGTLTAAILEAVSHETQSPGRDGCQLVTFEDHPFCQQALAENLGASISSVRLIDDLGALGPDERFDFLIVDGGRQDDESIFERLDPGATIFIEGDRGPQVEALARALRGRALAQADVRTLRRRTLANGRQAYDGGYRIYRLEPTIAARLMLAAIDLRTKLIYRLRMVVSSLGGGSSR